MKYQCNSCGRIYDERQDAVNCHPDINEIPDYDLDKRLAAQQSMHWTIGDSPRSKPLPRPKFDTVAQADTTPPDSQ